MLLNFINWNVDPMACEITIPFYINFMFVAYAIIVYLVISSKKKTIESTPPKVSVPPPMLEIKKSLPPTNIDSQFWDEEKELDYRWLWWVSLVFCLITRISMCFIFHKIPFGQILNPINVPVYYMNFYLHWYSFGFLFAFVSGYFIFLKIFKKEYVAANRLEELLLYLFFAVLIGARLGHCLFYEPSVYFSDSINIVSIILPIDRNGEFVGFQGLASHGAAIAILLAIWLYCRKNKMNAWWILDRLVIVVALGGAFIRLGNLFNSEIYGVETSLPWGFIFERNGETVPKHPTQLYEAISYFIIFVVCYIVYRKKNGQLHNGRLFGWWLVALFGMRFLIEFVKEEQVDFEKGMTLDMGQWLSVPFILGGIVLVILSHKGILKEGIFTDGRKLKK